MFPTNTNALPSENIAILAVKDPVSQGAATVSTGWVAAKDYHGFLARIIAGAIAGGGTLDAKLEQATSAAGAGAKDIAGKAITQMTQAGGSSNKQAMINCRPDELDIANNFTHLRLTLTAAVAASLLYAELIGFYPRYKRGDSGNIAAVAEIK